MAVCGLSLHLGSSESRKTLEQKFIFQIGTLNPALVLFIVSFLIKGVILNTNLTTVEVKLGRLSIMANM